MSAVRRTRVDVGGIHTRALSAGAQDATEAVMFVHGNPGSADDWESLVAAAGTHGRAVALDLPDFGDTQAPAGFKHTTDSYAAFLTQAQAQLGIERVHLVLHDFGGPIGLRWLASNPDRLASITLIDTGILPDYRWHFLARVWRAPLLGELFQATATRPAFRWLVNRSEPRGLPREFLDGMYDHYDRRTRAAVLELYRDADDPSAGAAELAALMAPRDVPALVVWGEHDAYLPASYAARQRDAFPSADVHVLAASGHWPYIDSADTVQRLLVDFLGRVLGRDAATSASASA